MTADTEEQMTAVPEAPAGLSRVVADLPRGVARRLRAWAALRGQPVSHVVVDVITKAVPSADQLAEDIRGGGSNDDQR
jgi:hypothetical protein